MNNIQEPKIGITGSIRQWMYFRGRPKNGRHKQVPLPEGNGKGYCPSQNGNIRWHEYYPSLSALADRNQYDCQPFNRQIIAGIGKS